jgi:hypothetical protein
LLNNLHNGWKNIGKEFNESTMAIGKKIMLKIVLIRDIVKEIPPGDTFTMRM